MLHTLLNSGRISDYKYIAIDGFAVYERAKSFRDSLLKAPEVGLSYAKYLAVPGYDAADARIDWYTPSPSKSKDGEYHIVKWSAASHEEKAEALLKLKKLENVLKIYGNRLKSRAENSDNMVLAHFLTGTNSTHVLPAIHFPNQDCVFIVDGEPVITFWGFVENNDDYYDKSPFLKLKEGYDNRTSSAFKAGAAGAGAAGAAADGLAGESQDNTGHKCAVVPWVMAHLPCLLGLLALLLLLALLWWLIPRFFNINLPFFNAPVPSVSAPATEQGVIGAVPADGDGLVLDGTSSDRIMVDDNINGASLAGLDAPVGAVPDLSVTDDLARTPALPDMADDAITGSALENSGVKDPNDNLINDGTALENGLNTPNTTAAVTDNTVNVNNADPFTGGAPVPIHIDPVAVSKGDLSVLNGQWQTKSGLMDSISGKPLNLSYSHSGDKGELTITRQDGVKCTIGSRADGASGSITIKADGDAVCRDNVTYHMPVIKCSQRSDGTTACVGQYDGQSPFPIRIFKQ